MATFHKVEVKKSPQRRRERGDRREKKPSSLRSLCSLRLCGKFLSLYRYIVSSCLLFFALSLSAETLIDLRQYKQDFVLETKRISVPGHPFAFNPSIIRWQGRILMSFRIIPGNKKSFNSELGLVWLDEQFNPVGQAQLLDCRDPDSPVPCRAEDGRLILVGDQLLMVYSDCPEPQISKGGFRVHVAQIGYDGCTFSILQRQNLTRFDGATRERREKNWVPFVYQDQLLLSYSINPHLVFRPLLWSNACEAISWSRTTPEWKWGDLLGGTPALPLGDHYLSFFHSSMKIASVQSEGVPMLHYFMGAYLFHDAPPFLLTHISPHPIIANAFYEGQSYEYYWKPIQAIYPCGFLHDEQFIWIAYGRQDHETWVVKLDKAGLLKSLVPLGE